MEPIDFIKMHGLGNDFVIIDGRNQVVENPSELAKYVNQRQFGVGCDQMILILPPQAGVMLLCAFLMRTDLSLNRVAMHHAALRIYCSRRSAKTKSP